MIRARWIAFVAAVMAIAALSVVAAQDEGDLFTEVIEFNGEDRDVIVYVPSEEPGLPVMFYLHGWGGEGSEIVGELDLISVATREDFIVVAPNAREPQRLWEQQDTNLMHVILDMLVEDFAIDESRVYVIGFSGGAFMTHHLGAVMADRVAAIASTEGYMPNFPDIARYGGLVAEAAEIRSDWGLPPQPDRAVPVMMVHSVNDRVVPYDGIPDTVAIWTEWNGCEGTPETEAYSDVITLERYAACAEDTSVVLYTVTAEDAGHGATADPELIPLIAEMWAFLSQYTLPEAS